MSTETRGRRGALLPILIITIAAVPACRPNAEHRSASPSNLEQNSVDRLQEALVSGDIEAVRRYIAAGGDLEVRLNVGRADGGQTPLHIAAGRGHVALVRMLLEAGADPNALSTSGNTPLSRAICGPDHGPQTVELLLAHGADPDLSTGRSKWTGLDWAAWFGDVRYVRLLVAAGANVRTDPTGSFVLQLVADSHDETWAESAQILIDAGADPNAINGQGVRFVDHPKVRSHPTFRRLVASAGRQEPASKVEQ